VDSSVARVFVDLGVKVVDAVRTGATVDRDSRYPISESRECATDYDYADNYRDEDLGELYGRSFHFAT
jgi:hypothetical protein